MNLVTNTYAGNPKLGIQACQLPSRLWHGGAWRHAGNDVRVPAHDVGVGARARADVPGAGGAVSGLLAALTDDCQSCRWNWRACSRLCGWRISRFPLYRCLGIIVLTGMDITTAVLLIDMVMKYRDRGVPRDEAIAQACPERLRPILMTAGITLLTMLPVALASEDRPGCLPAACHSGRRRPDCRHDPQSVRHPDHAYAGRRSDALAQQDFLEPGVPLACDRSAGDIGGFIAEQRRCSSTASRTRRIKSTVANHPDDGQDFLPVI